MVDRIVDRNIEKGSLSSPASPSILDDDATTSGTPIIPADTARLYSTFFVKVGNISNTIFCSSAVS